MVEKISSSFRTVVKPSFNLLRDFYRSTPAAKVPSTSYTSTEDLLATLIAMKTITGDLEANSNAIEFIDRFLSERGLFVKRFEHSGVESVLATTQRTKNPRVLLVGHIDVLPADDSMFRLHKQNKKLVGRGAFDMKFALACYLASLDSLSLDLKNYDFGILVNSDEEVGGFDSVPHIIDEGYIPSMCVLLDGGDDWAMETFARGIWHCTLTASGTTAHGSRPWEGHSANEQLLLALIEIKKLFPNDNKEHSTLNIGTLQGGLAWNQVSDAATADIDVRFATVEDDSRLRSIIPEICARYTIGFKVEVYTPPSINDPNNPYLIHFSDAIKQVIGRDPGTTFSYAGTDARFFTAKGVPCAIMRPPGGGHHGPDEWIDRQSLSQLQTILVNYIENEARI